LTLNNRDATTTFKANSQDETIEIFDVAGFIVENFKFIIKNE
jgi:hypothetical protein